MKYIQESKLKELTSGSYEIIFENFIGLVDDLLKGHGLSRVATYKDSALAINEANEFKRVFFDKDVLKIEKVEDVVVELKEDKDYNVFVKEEACKATRALMRGESVDLKTFTGVDLKGFVAEKVQ